MKLLIFMKSITNHLKSDFIFLKISDFHNFRRKKPPDPEAGPLERALSRGRALVW